MRQSQQRFYHTFSNDCLINRKDSHKKSTAAEEPDRIGVAGGMDPSTPMFSS